MQLLQTKNFKSIRMNTYKIYTVAPLHADNSAAGDSPCPLDNSVVYYYS